MFKLYNGCPNDELAAHWKSQSDARQRLAERARELFGESTETRVTYFPVEGKYHGCAWIAGKYHELTEEFHPTVESCASASLQTLEKLHECRPA